MRNVTLLILLAILSLTAAAQPELDNWIPNTTGLGIYDNGTMLITLGDSANVLQVCYDADDVYVVTEGLASYNMGPFSGNPNTPSGQDYTFVIPRNPTPSTNNTSITGGGAAVGVNGVPFFGYGDGRSYESSTNTNVNSGDGLWNADAWISEGTTMDATGNGHPTAGGVYHYHANPIQLYSDPSAAHSPIVGFALDGYPIYGPFGNSSAMDSTSGITRMASSYQHRSITMRTILPDGTTSSPAGPAVSASFPIGTYIEDYEYVMGLGDLDEFNGRDCVTPDYPNGTYAYFLSTDSVGDPKFPYIFAGAYYGAVSLQNLGPNVGNGTIPPGASCLSFACTVTASASTVGASCAGSSDGSATASGTGGTSPYTYAWSGGATSATATGLAAGTYTVTVTDGTGCTGTTTATVVEPAAVQATISVVHPSSAGNCDGEASAAAAGGTSPYTYAWSNGATSANTVGLCAGTYTVTVTDSNGCAVSNSNTLIDPPCVITVTTTSMPALCNGGIGTATANPSGGTSPYTYLWPTGDTASTINVSPGVYIITCFDAGGCSGEDTVTVAEPPAITGSVVPTNPTASGSCDGSATITPAGGIGVFTYSWANGATTATVTGLCAGQICVTVTDANGCTLSDCGTLNDPGCTLAATAIGLDLSCTGVADGSVSAAVSGGTAPFTYDWSSGGSTATETGLGAGTYTVTVTDSTGCAETATATVTEPVALVFSVSATAPTAAGACDGELLASATGGTGMYTYTWSNGATGPGITQLCDGQYCVTITDANGCSESDCFQITDPAGCLLTATIAGTNNACNGDADGTATTTPANGTIPYSYEWSGGGTGQTLSNLAAGMYTVTVTDDLGCTATASVNIAEPPPFSVALTATDESTAGANDGAITAAPSGGMMPLTFAWSNGDTGNSISGLAPDDYSLTVTDANGCTAESSVTVAPGSVGMATVTEQAPFAMYPNPASDQLTIRFSTAEGHQVQLLNALGEVVLSETATVQSTTLNVEALPAGMYIVLVSNSKQGATAQPIVIE